MKKLFQLLIIAVALCMTAQAQESQRFIWNDSLKTYVPVVTKQTKPREAPLEVPGKTVTIKGTVYQVMITPSSGHCFINRISAKGNPWRQYLGETISRECCALMKIQYVPSK